MCGRYVLSANREMLEDLGPFSDAQQAQNYKPSFNIAPSQRAPILRLEENGKPAFSLAKWGLIPSWAKDATIGVRMINARSESVMEKPSFKAPFEARRCLVPAMGFFEWKAVNSGSRAVKQPYYFHSKGNQLFTLAGLWETWTDPKPKVDVNGVSTNTVVISFTILTTEPNDLLADYHDRMPVIIGEEQRKMWLNPQAPLEALLELCGPFPAAEMDAYPVSRNVNSPAQNGPANIEAIKA
jgi:putative SOS response-associated peptidase YedK